MDDIKLRDALGCVLSLSSIGNLFLQTTKPWEDKNIESVISKLGFALITCYVTTCLFEPFIPRTAQYIKKYLGLNFDILKTVFCFWSLTSLTTGG